MRSCFYYFFSYLVLFIHIPCALAGGFQFYEMGTPLLGTASVGQAVVDDASASYFNPAAMSQLNSSELMLGSELIITKTRFNPNKLNTFRGNNGGNAGVIQPGMGLFSVFCLTPDLKFGLSLASPFGGILDYNNGWVGRYFVQTTNLLTLDLCPSVSYAVNDYLSLGAGVFVEYANLNQTIGIPRIRALGIGDGQADLRLEQYAPGFNLSLLFTPRCDTQFGISYRSRVNHRLKGNITFLIDRPEPDVTATLNLPQGIIASLSHEVTEQLTLLAEGGWSNWRIFQNTVITIRDVTLTIPRKWRDTYRFGVGSKLKLTPEWLLQCGASFDTSPAKKDNRLPDLPMDKQLRLGLGLTYSTSDAVTLGLNYEFIRFGKAAIDKATSIGKLSGQYSKNIGHFFGLSVNFKW